MTDVRMPIETTRDGNKITKVCVEDVYKIINRIENAMDKAYDESKDVLEDIDKKYWPDSQPNIVYEGCLIIGTGISQPCVTDVFDESIGNNIAFMKSKLNANIKKHNFLVKVYNFWKNFLDTVDKDLHKVDNNIKRDLNGIRQYNPDYLCGIEEKLGL